jgi:hypothetical protein
MVTIATLADQVAAEYGITDGPSLCDIPAILGLDGSVDGVEDTALTDAQAAQVRAVIAEANAAAIE